MLVSPEEYYRKRRLNESMRSRRAVRRGSARGLREYREFNLKQRLADTGFADYTAGDFKADGKAAEDYKNKKSIWK